MLLAVAPLPLATRLWEDSNKSVLLLEAGPDYLDFQITPTLMNSERVSYRIKEVT